MDVSSDFTIPAFRHHITVFYKGPFKRLNKGQGSHMNPCKRNVCLLLENQWHRQMNVTVLSIKVVPSSGRAVAKPVAG
jgi:hypothetical protein